MPRRWGCSAGGCGTENKEQPGRRHEGLPVEAESLAAGRGSGRGEGRLPRRTHAFPFSRTLGSLGLTSSCSEWEASGAGLSLLVAEKRHGQHRTGLPGCSPAAASGKAPGPYPGPAHLLEPPAHLSPHPREPCLWRALSWYLCQHPHWTIQHFCELERVSHPQDLQLTWPEILAQFTNVSRC